MSSDDGFAPTRPPDAERLSAWLDGALPPDEQARLGAWLDAHPADAQRVAAWAADRDRLQAHGAAWLDTPVPAAWRRLVLGRPAAAPWRQAAMVGGLLVAGAVLGAGGLLQWQRVAGGPSTAETAANAAPSASARGWVQRAAYAHAVYVPEPRHAVEVGGQEAHLAGWLTKRCDVPVKLFDLRAQGFELVGGRLLPDGGGKSAQLMYQDARGQRVTVYLRKPDAASETGFHYQQQGALGLFYWIEPGIGYALVGELPKAQLLALAEAIYRQQPAGGAAR